MMKRITFPFSYLSDKSLSLSSTSSTSSEEEECNNAEERINSNSDSGNDTVDSDDISVRVKKWEDMNEDELCTECNSLGILLHRNVKKPETILKKMKDWKRSNNP